MSVTTGTELDLAQLDGYKVKVTWNKQGEAEPQTREGSVVAASSSGILVKPKGAMLGELIAADEIISLEVVSEQNAKVTRRRLRLMKLTDVRQHLADRHGYAISALMKNTDASLLAEHDAIDHADLAHFHENREETALGQALADEDDGDND